MFSRARSLTMKRHALHATAGATGLLLVHAVSSCADHPAFPGGNGGVESVAMNLLGVACDDPSAARKLFLSYDEFTTLAPRAGITNPGMRITSTTPSRDEYEADCDYLIRQLCGESMSQGDVTGAIVVRTAHPDVDRKLGLDTAHVKYVVETDGVQARVRDARGRTFLFLRTSAGWKFAWIEE